MARTRKKYEKVQESILKDFGHLGSGSMLPPEVALVEKYGVSRVTVVRALNELVRDGVLERHQGRGTFITEKKLRPQTKSIGVLSSMVPEPGFFHPFYGPMREGVYETAFESDYTVTLIGARNRKTGAILEPAQAASKPIDGLIVLGIMNADYCARLHETGIPLVGLEYHFEHVAPIDYVVQNCDESAKEITEILIKEGHTRIAFFGQASENINTYHTPDQNVFERLMGIRWGFQAVGVQPSEDLFFQAPHRFGTTRKALEAIYASDSPPTAVFCPDPQYVKEVLGFLGEKNWPKEKYPVIVAVGPIDVEDSEVTVWCIEEDTGEMGRAAATRLLERLADPTIDPQIIKIPWKLRRTDHPDRTIEREQSVVPVVSQ